MKVHNFTEEGNDEYKRAIFCTRCGQVAWFYNYMREHNLDLQSNIKDCVENGESFTPIKPKGYLKE